MDESEKKLSGKLEYRGKSFGVLVDDVLTANGNTEERIWIDFPQVCIIVPFINPETVILVRQYRYAIKRLTFELPAGKVESDEKVEIAAKRELEEETGYTSEINVLFNYVPTPHYSNEIIWICLATNLTLKSSSRTIDNEIYEAKLMPLALTLEMILNGAIIDGKTITALLYLRNYKYIDDLRLLV